MSLRDLKTQSHNVYVSGCLSREKINWTNQHHPQIELV